MAIAFCIALLVTRASASAGQTLRLSETAGPNTLLPILSTTTDADAVGRLIFDPLIRFNAHLQPEPVLAARVPTLANGDISRDGRRVRIHLRTGITWHDGVAFGAGDVVFTIRTVLDPRVKVPNRDLYANIASVTATNASTVVFRLRAPQASVISDVLAGYPIVPAHLLAKSRNLATDDFNANPVGTGPYRFVRWLRGDHIDLDANPRYVLGAPHIEHVRVSIIPDSNTLAIAVRRGDIDYALVGPSLFDELGTSSNVRRLNVPRNMVMMFAMNQSRAPLNEPAVRAAIALAIDRRRIVETVNHGFGEPAYADLPESIYGGHPSPGWDRVDLAGARGMLDRAGWRAGADGLRTRNGAPLRLTLADVGGVLTESQIDTQIMSALKDLGIAVDFRPTPAAQFFAPADEHGTLHTGNFDLAYAAQLGGVDPGNATIYRCADRIPAGNNTSGYCNPEMDRLQLEANAAYDPTKRRAIITRIEDLAVRDHAYLYISHTPWLVAATQRLHGASPSAAGDYWYAIERWTLDP